MRNKILILFLISFPIMLSGQSAEQEVIQLKQNQNVFSDETVEMVVPETPGTGNWNMSLGTSFTYMKGFGSGMMMYAAPTYTIPLNNRWALHGGLIASQYQGLNRSFIEGSTVPNTFSSLAVFVAGSYQLNDRFMLHGSGTKQLLSAPVTPFTPYPMDNLSLGATYRIGNNMTIGASIHMNQGNGYYSSPFSGNMFQSPLYW